MSSYKYSDIDFTNVDTSEAYSVFNGKAVNKYNSNTGRFKLWGNKMHTMVFTDIDVFNDFAHGNKTLFANIMILVQHVDAGNILIVKKGGRKYPVSNEETIMEILQVKERMWRTVRKDLFDDKLPILKKATFIYDDKKVVRYYVNPLVTTSYKGISIPCYKLFKEHIKPFLSVSDLNTLEKLSKEYDGE